MLLLTLMFVLATDVVVAGAAIDVVDIRVGVAISVVVFAVSC